MYERMRELREDNDLLQKQVAIMLDITRQQYGLYENGTREMPIKILIKLAEFYNTSTDYILGLTKTRVPYPRKEK